MRHLLLSMILCLVCSCQQENKPLPSTQIRGVAMTVPYQITMGDPLSSEEKRKVQEIALAVFNHVHDVFDHYNAASELSKINADITLEPITLSADLAEVLHLADRVHKETAGRFDPTVLTLQKIWMDHLDQGTTPKKEELLPDAENISWQQISLEGLTLIKKRPQIQLNLDGIAKGWCVDKIAEALSAAGYKNFLVDWGGEIAARGTHPEGRPWRLFISHFGSRNPDLSQAVVEMDNNAIATSGNYLQKWKTEDKIYTHLFDMKKRVPLEVKKGAIASVSVLAPSCAYADALATAIMLFEDGEAATAWSKEFTEEHPEVRIWIQEG